MLPIPENVLARFSEALKQRKVNESFYAYYRKWLRYYLDFCSKYPPSEDKSEQVRYFIEKLKSKKQTPQQCTQAAHAVSLFFESQQPKYFPLPQRLIPKLKTQMEVVSDLHDKDLAAGYAGVFLVDSLEKKYPAAAKDFI